MLIIGERINPTGKPELAQAIREGNQAFIQNEAKRQVEAGASALDINVGIPAIDRISAIRFIIQAVRVATELPLVIDDTDPEVVEHALDYIGNGAFINAPIDSESTRFFEMAKIFNAGLIVLPLKSGKLPETVREHVETAGILLKRLEDTGIQKENVLIDAMLYSLKSEKSKAMDALERIKRLKSELNVKTLIGLSNVSFGLRDRETINAEFLKLAKSAGVDAVICDPFQKKVMEAASAEDRDSDSHHFLEFAERISKS